MHSNKRIEIFEQLVSTKFDVYNSLFLNLPYRKVRNIGILIPLLVEHCTDGLKEGKDPIEIMEDFFVNMKHTNNEQEKIDFMFRVIQYVERQVVLFDSVEDAAFKELSQLGNYVSIDDFLNSVSGEDSADKVAEKLSDFSARMVFTAHPTQFYPPSVLDIITSLRNKMQANDLNGIDTTLQQLGLTSLINAEKPTPFDEAKNIIYFLRYVYYEAIGNLYTSIKDRFGENGFDNPNLIQLGFWPGGDRDGNPFVTAEITKNVANELRMTLMKCYYHDVKKLQQKLTFGKIESILNELRDNLYELMFNPSKYISYSSILEPLEKAKTHLVNSYHGLHLSELDKLIDKVTVFKTHFASLDIRQDHSVHYKAITAILKSNQLINENLEELTTDRLIDILLNNQLEIELDKIDDPVVEETLKNIAQLKDIQEKNGEEGCNRYVISNSEDIYSVLFVFALFRWSGWNDSPLSFDIVPLFETMEGMKESEGIMRTLFDLSDYRKHITNRNNKQTMMLGFSDGTKDGGYLKANWSIFKTKETLSQVCKEYEIDALFFDGRGGPPARGGGKTHRFYAAQSDQIANNDIQLTVQGQTISSTFGTEEQFVHNCEQLISAGLSNHFFGSKNNISDTSRSLIEQLAEISFEKYTSLKNHDKFIPYLENKSTLKYYGKAKIGSRPGKRGNKKQLELTDLRAISFVGSWSQLKQNVPGYFGIGTALKQFVDEGKTEELKQLFHEVPFFKALMLNSMMSLCKSNFELTSYMQSDEEYAEFWNILKAEYSLSKEMLLLISGYDYLMEKEPVSRNSVLIRDRIVLPLLVIQQYSLQKISQNTEHKTTYEKIVTRSLYGNINASRNSA